MRNIDYEWRFGGKSIHGNIGYLNLEGYRLTALLSCFYTLWTVRESGHIARLCMGDAKDWVRDNGKDRVGLFVCGFVGAVGLLFVLGSSLSDGTSNTTDDERLINLQAEQLQRTMESDRALQQRDLEIKVKAIQIDIKKHPELYQ